MSSLEGLVFTSELDKPLAALDVLAEQAWVRDSALSGSRVRVRVARGTDDAQGLLRSVLAGAGIAVEGVRQTRPSLEDVFVALVGDAGEGGVA